MLEREDSIVLQQTDVDSPEFSKLINDTQHSLLFRKKLILIGHELKQFQQQQHPLSLLLKAFKDFVMKTDEAKKRTLATICQSITDFLEFFKNQLMSYYRFQTARQANRNTTGGGGKTTKDVQVLQLSQLRILDSFCKELFFDLNITSHLAQLVQSENVSQVKDYEAAADLLRHWSLDEWQVDKNYLLDGNRLLSANAQGVENSLFEVQEEDLAGLQLPQPYATCISLLKAITVKQELFTQVDLLK